MKKNSLILFLFIFFINTSCSKKVAIDRDGPGNIEKIVHYEVAPQKVRADVDARGGDDERPWYAARDAPWAMQQSRSADREGRAGGRFRPPHRR